MRKNLEGKSNKWVDELNPALWVVQTLTRSPTEETTYALVYGSEAVVLTELALPTFRISIYNQETNKRVRCLDLNLLKERRIVARLRTESYIQKNKKHIRQEGNEETNEHRLLGTSKD